MKRIKLTKGKYALVDNADYSWLNSYNWHLQSWGYAATQVDKEYVLMHRLIMKTPKGKVTDHINQNKLDNRRGNLRVCTQSANLFNTGTFKHNKSGLRGVSWDKVNNTWRVCIKLDQRQNTIGRWKDKETAYNARLNAEIQLC